MWKAMSEPESTQRPAMLGLRHLALWIEPARFGATVAFYREGLGMRLDWQPDDDNVYLTSGKDNLALHRAQQTLAKGMGRLDHLGFFVADADTVHAWHRYLLRHADALGIEILAAPRLHRDGATSFYLLDPSGTQVQIIHVPSCT